jgi:Tfp pilus assembly protein PilV
MLRLRISLKSQIGDTIVEVLISIAIVALAISISYAISGKNLNVGITARERTQALALVQGQIERMKAAHLSPDADTQVPKLSNVHFCYDDNALRHDNPPSINPDANALSTDAPNYLANCVISGKYYLDINYIDPATDPALAPTDRYGDSFAVTARWYQIGGGTDQIVTLYYRPW